MLRQPPLPEAIRPLSNEASARLKAHYPNLASSPEKCLTCQGTKTYRWYAPGSRTEIVDYECDCVDQWVLHRVFLSSNIGLAYQHLGWEDMGATEQGALDIASDYLDNVAWYVNRGFGLIFHGGFGTGKTSLATLILRNLISQGHDGYFTTFSEMIDTYTGGWNDAIEKAWFHKRIKNAGVLVLDDIGKEYKTRKNSDLPESTFDEVLRHRVAAGTPTIITTNLSLTDLQQGYGGSVMSLLNECSTTYEFTGEDFRRNSTGRVDVEMASRLTRPVVIG